MALAHGLEQVGYNPQEVKTIAHVYIDKIGGGFQITTIKLETQAKVPEIKENEFMEQAEKAKTNCPVSKALKGPEIKLKAELIK